MTIDEQIKGILEWLEPTLKQNENPQDFEYWSKMKTIFFEHKKEVLIESIKENKFYSFIYVMQYVMRKNRNILEEIKEQIKREEELQNQINSWLEIKCAENNIEGVVFLLNCVKDNKIKELIKASNFDSFKKFVKKLKEVGIITREKIKELVTQEVELQSKLNNWLEIKYAKSNIKDATFLLNCGASKKEALKISIKKPRFESFKILITKEESLLTEIKNSEWNKENELQKQLDKWLEIKCDKDNIEDVIFLLNCGSDIEIIYNKIKGLIGTSNFDSFKMFVKKLEEVGIITYEKIKELVTQEVELQNKLNNWLEIKYAEKSKNDIYLLIEDIKILLSCGAEIKTIYNKIKGLIGTSNFDSFKIFVKKLEEVGIITYEKIKELVTQEVELQNKLNNWLEEKCDKNIEDIKFLLSCGAEIKTIYNKIKGLIETSNFDNFKKFVKKLKEVGIITYEKIKELVKTEKNLQDIMNKWLEKRYEEKSKNDICLLIEDIKLLLSCGAKQEIIKNLIFNKKTNNSIFDDFKLYAKFEQFKIISFEELCGNINHEEIKILLESVNEKTSNKYSNIIKQFNDEPQKLKFLLKYYEIFINLEDAMENNDYELFKNLFETISENQNKINALKENEKFNNKNLAKFLLQMYRAGYEDFITKNKFLFLALQPYWRYLKSLQNAEGKGYSTGPKEKTYRGGSNSGQFFTWWSEND